MRARFRYLVDLVRNSYWFVPSLMTLGSVALVVLASAMDARFKDETLRSMPWIYTGGTEGARAVLSTIAGSSITVAGVTFSITIVALTLASSQFGPRVLNNFMRDRGNQVVLGTFIATYLYSLLVLRSIRDANGDLENAIVPQISISIALLLTLASLGVLIFFIHHVAISIQAPHLIASIARELHGSIDALFPEEVGRGTRQVDARSDIPMHFDRESALVISPETGYLEAVDLEGLMDLAKERDLIVRVELRPGKFATEGSALARVWPDSRVDEEIRKRVRDSFAFGSRRTAIQDAEFSVDQLVEVAVRALSPGINDPFTAITCIDHLGAALCHLAGRELPLRHRRDENGDLRLIASRPTTFSGVTDTALNQIRQNASYHASVYIRMLETITGVVEYTSDEDRLDVLRHHAEMILRQSLEQVPEVNDQAEIKERYRALAEAMRTRRHLSVPDAS